MQLSMHVLQVITTLGLLHCIFALPWNSAKAPKNGIDPEVYMDFCQTVIYHGHRCEEYKNVQTIDGYLLTIHRINGRLNESASAVRKPVFLQHGLISSSYSFIMNQPNDSLAFILSDAGFDVWLGNSRGNTYSMKHVKYNIRQKEFWDFSWQEMALYDLPISIELVQNKTNANKIPYIGHSQGNLMAFVHQALTKDQRISHLIALAPIFHLQHVRGPFRLLIPLRNKFGPFFENLTQGEFLARSNFSQWEATHLCNHPLLQGFCEDFLFIAMGRDSKYFNETRLPVYTAHMPDGCSVRDMLHYVQMMMSGNCSFYDFGQDINTKKYKQPQPPVFRAEDISTPVTLFAGEKDPLADDTDVEYLRKNLPNLVNDVYVKDWNHGDFVMATNLPSKMARLIIAILKTA